MFIRFKNENYHCIVNMSNTTGMETHYKSIRFQQTSQFTSVFEFESDEKALAVAQEIYSALASGLRVITFDLPV